MRLLKGLRIGLAALTANRLRAILARQRADVHPPTLSGGEQQRLAGARAVVNNPKVILADEPAGALDTERGQAVIEQQRRRLGREGNAVVIVVTHDERMLTDFDPRLSNGRRSDFVKRATPAARWRRGV